MHIRLRGGFTDMCISLCASSTCHLLLTGHTPATRMRDASRVVDGVYLPQPPLLTLLYRRQRLARGSPHARGGQFDRQSVAGLEKPLWPSRRLGALLSIIARLDPDGSLSLRALAATLTAPRACRRLPAPRFGRQLVLRGSRPSWPRRTNVPAAGRLRHLQPLVTAGYHAWGRKYRPGHGGIAAAALRALRRHTGRPRTLPRLSPTGQRHVEAASGDRLARCPGWAQYSTCARRSRSLGSLQQIVNMY